MMPTFEITDPNTGRKVRLTGDSPPTQAELEQIFSSLERPSQETLEERARRLGAQPGVALTPEQQQQIALNQPIQAEQPTLPEGRAFQPVGATEQQLPVGRAFQQGLQNIGSGILRGIGELRRLAGDEEAQQFLADLSQSTAIEQGRTREITEGAPIQEFLGQVAGESVAFPIGGVGRSLTTRLLTATGAGAIGGGLSAAGRGEDIQGIREGAALGGAFGGGTQAVAEGVGGAARAFVEGRRAARAAQELGVPAQRSAFERAAREVERGQQVAERTFPLLPAQKTLNPFQKQETAFLGDNPEVSTRAFDVLTKQNEDAAFAVNDLLNQIALPEIAATAASKARRAGSNIISQAKLIRQEKTSPLYEGAFKRARNQNIKVDVEPTLDLIDQRLRDFTDAGEVSRQLGKVRNILSDRKIGDLKVAHSAKMDIDELIRQGLDKNSLSDVAVRELEGVQKSLINQMDDLNVGYRTAREEFRRLSPAIDDLRDGVFGRLARLQEAGLERASNILFDPRRSDPAVMRNAIKTLKGVDGGADIARGLLRAQLQQRVNTVRPVLERGGVSAVENIPATLNRALFGTLGQRRVLFAGLKELSPEAFENAKWLQEGLTRAAQARPGGSPTGIRNVIREKFRGISARIANFIFSPRQTAAEAVLEGGENARIRAAGDILYDPNWIPDMTKIRKLAPTDPDAPAAFEKLLNKILLFNEKTGAITSAQRIGAQQLEDEAQQ